MSQQELNSSMKSQSTKPNRAKKNLSSKNLMAMGLTAVALTGGVKVASAIGGGQRHSQQEAALLSEPRDQVLGEIGTGQLNPDDLTQVTVKDTVMAYDEASRITGGLVNSNSPLITEAIDQTPNASPSSTYIQQGTDLIVPREDIPGNPPSVTQQVKTGQQVIR